ncbi:MAG: hypothetical protein ACRDLA_07510, partial [Thermoleophilaceae bacterium]
MQDHRNWTDANYKSYGTPMDVPWPFEAEPGHEIRQSVRISVAGELPAPRPPAAEILVEPGAPAGRGLPRLGLAAAGHGRPLSDREADLLAELRPDHLRVDLALADPGWPERLAGAAEEARRLGCALELVLALQDDAGPALDELARHAGSLAAPVARVLVFPDVRGFSAGYGSTPPALLALARDRLVDGLGGVPIGGGSHQFFNELNRDRPDVSAMDVVAFSVNPQVHAADDGSLVENLAAQEEVVRFAQTFCAGRPLAVTPVTFVGRSGPFPAGPPLPGGLPGQVDVRQAGLFGAGWTLGSVKHLAAAGADSVTYFETVGWRRGSGRPGSAPSRPLPPSSRRGLPALPRARGSRQVEGRA